MLFSRGSSDLVYIPPGRSRQSARTESDAAAADTTATLELGTGAVMFFSFKVFSFLDNIQ